MGGKRFSNQNREQVISHLYHFLNDDIGYNLSIDPLGIRFMITESTKRRRKPSEKRKQIKEEQKNMRKRHRKLSNTKKRTRPKIRSVKKGRTVALKGRVC
jgi:hypothetical protein